MNSQRARAIELFSGAGFLGLAFNQAGFEIAAAYELDLTAAETCSANVSKTVIVSDLARQKPTGKCQLLIAGPPCQGHSTIGARVAGDPRNNLALIIPKWAAATKAEVVVVENVCPFLESSQFRRMKAQMEKIGYSATIWTLNARDFGVAQNRVRAFSIFSMRGEPKKPSSLPAKDIRTAFARLPKFPRESLQHFTLQQSPFAMRRIRLIPEGGDIRDLAKRARHLVPPSWFKTKGKVVDIWGRLRWDAVSNTIRTGFLNPSRGRHLHPDEDRPISFREGARLQDVPDEFYFVGKAEQVCRQIGNGVPLGLGRAVAKSVRELF